MKKAIAYVMKGTEYRKLALLEAQFKQNKSSQIA